MESLDFAKLKTPEVEAISAIAGLRRQGVELKRMLLVCANPEEESQKLLIAKVKKEADGFVDISKEEALKQLKEKEAEYKNRAQEFVETVPNYASYLLGYIAKLKQIAGENFDSEFEQSKKLAVKAENLSEVNPDDLLTQAEILGIQRRIAQGKEIPSIEDLAKIASSNKKLAKDIALVLDEKDRETFVSLLPETQRREISALMDHELSNVLSENIIEANIEKSQAEAVKGRTSNAVEQAFGNPDEATLPMVKVLSKTLAQLDSDDSKRLLLELGKSGLAGEKDKKKHKLKISYSARVVKELADIDIAKGGNLAMKFLAKKEVPNRLFKFFCEKLVKEKYLTEQLEKYLSDDKNLPFLKKIIAVYPNQFNTVIDTISKIKNYSPAEKQEEIFSAIEDLDSLTPIIFNRYRQANAVGKKELSKQIRELKPKFFCNISIKDILPPKDREILAEMVYLAYRPVNMSFEKVQGLINRLEDQTEDLANYIFPEKGYPFLLEANQAVTLKEGESIDIGKLKSHKNILSASYPEKEDSIKKFSALLSRLAKGGSVSGDELADLLSIVSRDELVTNFLKRFDDINSDNTYNYLNELKEIFGIYFKDNYGERLNNFLDANPTVEGQLMKILSNPDRQKVLKTKLGKLAEGIDWNKITDKKEISRLMTVFIGNSMLKSIKEDINRSINKFTTIEGEKVTTVKKNLKAYVSKNIGSFFAKASAGICTAEDIPLFERNDHFHINIVENDEYVRANIQAYIITEKGKRSLVLRGFNPNTDFLDKIDAGGFCEKVLEIARKFQQDNNLSDIYITEQGGWHALSNREKVASYLVKKYAKSSNAVSYSLLVASSSSISTIYRV